MKSDYVIPPLTPVGDMDRFDDDPAAMVRALAYRSAREEVRREMREAYAALRASGACGELVSDAIDRASDDGSDMAERLRDIMHWRH